MTPRSTRHRIWTPLLAASLLLPVIGGAKSSHAAIVEIVVPDTVEFVLGAYPPFIVDITVNGLTEPTDFTFGFASSPTFTTPFISSSRGEFGADVTNNIAVTQGTDFVPDFYSGAFVYNSNENAMPGLNYARYDVNTSGVYETVIELDLGVSPDDDQEDRITRIFYDNTGANLDISTVVPTPTAAAAGVVLLCLFMFKRRRP